jgi:hypothetical protein
MRRILSGMLLLGCSFAGLSAQSRQSDGCSTQMEFAPVLVANPGLRVTFKCSQATALDLIRSVGRQTRTPIGVVLGRNTDALTKDRRSYDLENVAPETALREAARDANYTLKQEGPVWVLVADDVTSRQSSLLSLSYTGCDLDFSGTMVGMGVSLTMCVRITASPEIQGFGGSILGSLNDERLTLKVTPSSTTEEIANMIVSLGSRGMWILRAEPDYSDHVSIDEVEMEPYQHYSNRPNSQ